MIAIDIAFVELPLTIIVFDVLNCLSGLRLTHRNKISALLLTWLLLLAFAANADAQKTNPLQRIKVDQDRAVANGIRRIEGQHLDLYTDLRDCPDIDQLVDVFDAATPQWCEYFNVNPRRAESWKVTGFVIGDREKFVQAGLMPAEAPDFQAGYNCGDDVWVYVQPGNYYTRHLLLHEGTHAFMQHFLGGSGPPWYSEGMAELLALHSWQDGKLKLNCRVSSSDQAEYWGRPKKIRKARDANMLKSLDEVMAINSISSLDVETYAWCWAACDFLQAHPLTKVHFSNLTRYCEDDTNKFTTNFQRRIKSTRPAIDRDWALFLNEIDYGIPPDRVVIQPAKEVQPNQFLIGADHGWQVTSFEVQQGDRLKIGASGQIQVRQTSKPWLSEANGVTIDYYRGRPLATLLMGIVEDGQIDGLREGIAVGTAAEVVAERSGRLGFRINESPAGLDDNRGELTVSIEKID